MYKKYDVAVSGYFIWPHVGHIRYFQEASMIGDVTVILNNDLQQQLKYGKIIVPVDEREEVLESIKYVDNIMISIDDDETVCKSIERLKPDLFLKGGDWNTNHTPPEKEVCDRLIIPIIYNVGGGKIQSSSKLIEKSKNVIGNDKI